MLQHIYFLVHLYLQLLPPCNGPFEVRCGIAAGGVVTDMSVFSREVLIEVFKATFMECLFNVCCAYWSKRGGFLGLTAGGGGGGGGGGAAE